MDTYTLTKEDWDTSLELGMLDRSGDDVLKKIPSSVKSAFTRTYNKQIHMTPFSSSTSTGKSTRSMTAASMKVDMEEALDGEDEVGEEETGEDGDGLGKDVVIPKSKSKAGASRGGGTLKRGRKAK
jgi:replication factor C subunit 1